MWDTPFDESMLDQRRVIILCKTEEDAISLFHMLRDHGITWYGQDNPVTHAITHFSDRNGAGTCYHVTDIGLMYGPCYVAESERRWADYTKCTFGAPCVLPDISIPDDAERSLMGW